MRQTSHSFLASRPHEPDRLCFWEKKSIFMQRHNHWNPSGPHQTSNMPDQSGYQFFWEIFRHFGILPKADVKWCVKAFSRYCTPWSLSSLRFNIPWLESLFSWWPLPTLLQSTSVLYCTFSILIPMLHQHLGFLSTLYLVLISPMIPLIPLPLLKLLGFLIHPILWLHFFVLSKGAEGITYLLTFHRENPISPSFFESILHAFQ